MRSGNGRHRRPRQAPAIFVTVGVTGAGIALPLLGASGAHAADTATWDKVAQCESGGVWSAASGNGYYGGLQLTQELWDTYGGAAYASRPDLASRSQQIAVAQSILDARGPDQWSSCAVSAGLAKDGRAPEVDPGSVATPSPAPSDADGSSDPWDSSGSSGTHDDPDSAGRQRDEPRDEPSDPAPSPDATDSGRSGDASTSPEPSEPTRRRPTRRRRTTGTATRRSPPTRPTGQPSGHDRHPAGDARQGQAPRRRGRRRGQVRRRPACLAGR